MFYYFFKRNLTFLNNAISYHPITFRRDCNPMQVSSRDSHDAGIIDGDAVPQLQCLHPHPCTAQTWQSHMANCCHHAIVLVS